jgi:cysteine desulfurase family protein (TIGR01976 family)
MPDISTYIRRQFPSLKNKIGEFPIAYLDGPGGYQVPACVIEAMQKYLVNLNANIGGSFPASIETARMLQNSREVFADFFNCSWEEVAFGANATTLNFMLAQALMREMKAGDRVVITEIDHEANRSPWLELQERGIIVEEVALDITSCTLDMDDFKQKILPNTKVVACNYASNAVGTICDVKEIVRMAQAVGAYTVIDAVHYAAHGPIDVKNIEADFVLCSAYKVFGPHIGVMYAKKDVANKLRTMLVRPARHYPPYCMETGTLNHEGIAGAAEAVEFVAGIGEQFGAKVKQDLQGLHGRRRNVVAGLGLFKRYEEDLTDYLTDELSNIPGITIYGPPNEYPCTSTVSFTYGGHNPGRIAKYLASKGLFVWNGDFFATRLVERLGLLDQGGLVRVGIAPYNTQEELERLVKALDDQASLVRFVERNR